MPPTQRILRLTSLAASLLLLAVARPAISAETTPAPGWSSSWSAMQSEQQRNLREILKRWDAAKQTHQYKPVLALCDREVAARPRQAVSYTVRALVEEDAGRFDDAGADFTRGLQIATKSYDHKLIAIELFSRAQCSWHQRRWSAAIADLRGSMRATDNNVLAYNGLAWILATCPDGSVRNGVESLQFAQRACAVTRQKNVAFLDTLAAAYAETGDYAAAAKVESASLDAARKLKASPVVEMFQKLASNHLASYQRRQPVRDEPARQSL